MAEVFFSYSPGVQEHASVAKWAAVLGDLHRAVAREYYTAHTELEITPGPHAIKLAKAALGEIRVVHFHAPGISRTRRSMEDVRFDGMSHYLIWFIVSGGLDVTQNGKRAAARDGQFIITRSDRPFHLTTIPDLTGLHESYQVIVPQHAMAHAVPEATRHCVKAFDLARGPSMLAFQIFSSLFENSEAVSPENAADLAQQALTSLASFLEGGALPRDDDAKSLARNRVEKYLQSHLEEPKLTAAKVANACNLSVRHLHSIFAGGTSFHQYLTELRLTKARSLLEQRGKREMQVTEVAYLTGYVSAAHFSRSFRKKYGCSPRDWRKVEWETVRHNVDGQA